MPTRLTYLQARILLLLLGIAVAVSQSLLAYERGAAPTEVLAPILYIPVFAGAIFWYLVGGLVAAAISSVIYGTLLADQVAVVGLRPFFLLLVTRVSFYVLFGVVVALGVRYIEGRLRKLEIYDQIDDETGLYNSGFFLQDSDLETSRANRYQTLFSVVRMDVTHQAFEGMSNRRYRRTLRDLATRIEGSIRQVDRPARAIDDGRDVFLLILPQTAREGAGIFADRLRVATEEFLTERGCRPDGNLTVDAITYPDEPDRLGSLREEIAQIEAGRRVVRGES